MKKGISIIAVFFLLSLSGCSNANDIDSVKDATMDGYQTLTIGNAFEGSFDNPTWTKGQTDKGQNIVEFAGTISQKTHDAAVLQIKTNVSQEQILEDALSKGKTDFLRNLPNTLEGIAAAIDDYLDIEMWPMGTPVTAQWAIAVDGKSFELDGLYSEAWEGVNQDHILNIIYN
jgi:hypothetical protein